MIDKSTALDVYSHAMTVAWAQPTPLQFVQLLADEQRWHLLQQLARSDRTVRELTALIGRPQNLVSYHLAALRNAGVVSARRSSADGRDTYYRAELQRCAGLLSRVGSALQPGLRLEARGPRALDAGANRRRPSVLFLCTGNSARSQMAEALLERLSRGAIRASSAGSHPKPLHPHAVRAMARRGIDISTRRSKHLDRFTRARFDRVVTLCDRVRETCPEFSGAAAAHWSMPDPAAPAVSSAGERPATGYAAFERTAEELEWRIPFLIDELLLESTRRRSDEPQ
jgi:protein-tyrosine-phosphatase/DNA-binding transcriptional ArsR family regulator